MTWKPPSFRYAEKKLAPYEIYVDVALAMIIIISIMLLFFGSRSAKTLWVTWLALP